MISQYDKVFKHIANGVQNRIRILARIRKFSQKFSTSEWSSQKCDFDSIKNPSGFFKRKIRDIREFPFKSILQLQKRVEQQWNETRPGYCWNCIQSISKSIKTILKARIENWINEYFLLHANKGISTTLNNFLR